MSGKARAFIIGNETGSKIGDWDKYLGGEIGPDGLVYAIPGSAKYVLRIDPSTEIVEPVGRALKGPFVKSSLPANQLKWLRGIRAPANGCIYGIPANANSVLKIDPAKCAPALELGDASSDGLRLLGDGEAFLRGRWKWHGAALGGDGNVYAIPCNSPHVLKVDPRNDALSLLSISCPAAEARSDAFCPRDPQKWYGGLLANDGNIYGIPMNAPSVLRISPREQRAELLPIDARASPAAEVSPSDRWKWHGGVLGADGRCIYGMPSHADAVLKIVPATGRAYALGKLPKRDTDDHGKYKYGGAVVDPTTGIVYGIPSDADGVLKIVPATCPGRRRPPRRRRGDDLRPRQNSLRHRARRRRAMRTEQVAERLLQPAGRLHLLHPVRCRSRPQDRPVRELGGGRSRRVSRH